MSLRGLEHYHDAPYASISVSRPELSQAGQTVLVTGGGSGIGLAIAHDFVIAKAAKVIIVGRRGDVIDAAVQQLQAVATGTTIIEGFASDVADVNATATLWDKLAKKGTHIDVLVLNAAIAGNPTPLIDQDLSEAWYSWEVNARSLLDFTQRFHKQDGFKDKKHYLVHVSSVSTYLHSLALTRPTYGPSKNAGTLLLQTIARTIPADNLQIVSFHPGFVLSEGAKESEFELNSQKSDDPHLAGNFSVWAATPLASFLHGRFVWANWDVDELRDGPNSVVDRAEKEPDFLTVGIHGLYEGDI